MPAEPKPTPAPVAAEPTQTHEPAFDEAKEKRIAERLSRLIKPEEIEAIQIEATAKSLLETLAALHPLARVKVEIPYDAYLASKTPGSTWEPPNARASSSKTWHEIVAPLQADFDESGMTDEELSEFIEAEVAAYRAERRAKANAA